jgi:hypothetical protein
MRSSTIDAAAIQEAADLQKRRGDREPLNRSLYDIKLNLDVLALRSSILNQISIVFRDRVVGMTKAVESRQWCFDLPQVLDGN